MPEQGMGAQLGASELKARGDSGELDTVDQLSWRSQHHLQMLLRSRDAVGLENVTVRGWQVRAQCPQNRSEFSRLCAMGTARGSVGGAAAGSRAQTMC